MPTIGVKRDLLFAALGKTYTDDEFERLCFEFGLELDEVTSEKQMLAKEQGADAPSSADASEDVIYRIDIPANRYDLLCLEGLKTGLLVFQKRISELAEGDAQKLVIRAETGKIRPHAVAAVLRDVTFTEDSYRSFIDLQEKLHQNICRKRTLVAIGTHDLDAVEGPFTYDAKPPGEIRFRALNQDEERTGAELVELYSTHAQLKAYVPIIRDSPVYPVIYDAKGRVLSMPPLINSHLSRISAKTRNVFIECTATDLAKAEVVLDTLVCAFSQYCRRPFTAERVEVVPAKGGESAFYPSLCYRTETVSVKKVNGALGLTLDGGGVRDLLDRMCLSAELLPSEKELRVTVPPTRHDVLHACDVYEDVAIAYGYNRIPKTLPATSATGRQLPLSKLSELLRHAVSRAGFTEALTFALCSADDLAEKLRRPDDVAAVRVSNPKTLEFQAARTTLLPGLLKTLAANRKMPLPLKLFEVSDVVLKDVAAETGSRNERRLCAVHSGKAAGFEVAHGLLDRVMLLLEVPRDLAGDGSGYRLRPAEDPSFFPRRCAEVVCRGQIIGKIGVLHPDVLGAFDVTNPCSCFEICIESFV